jgi:prepilin-type N-terminal cleavage/methylation domain-containing protein
MNKGFTMMELLMAILVLVIALVGLLYAYVGCFNLNETARNLTVATNAAQQRMEEIRNTSFDSIVGAYNNQTFTISNWLSTQDYIGKSFVTTVVANQLLKATVVICWRQGGGRIIGQAQDSGGNLVLIDDTENAQSPCVLVTYIARR